MPPLPSSSPSSAHFFPRSYPAVHHRIPFGHHIASAGIAIASTPSMALGMSATMAFLLLVSFVVVSHCGALQVDSATKASSFPAKVHADHDAEGLLRLPSSVAEPDPDRSLEEPVAEPDPDRSPVEVVAEPDPDRSPVRAVAEPDPDRSPAEAVAEPDPDRSQLDSDELAIKKPCSEGRKGDEKVKEQIDDEDMVEEKEKANRKKEGKKKTKKHHDGDARGKKEKAKKHHRQSAEEVKEEESTKNRIHRHHHADESAKKKNKLSHHIKSSDNSDDRDEDEEEKKGKRWRKAIKSRFGHGRRSQREEAE